MYHLPNRGVPVFVSTRCWESALKKSWRWLRSRRSSGRQTTTEKTNETRSWWRCNLCVLALRYSYYYWQLNTTPLCIWFISRYIYIHSLSMNIYSVSIYIWEKDRETNRYLLLQSQMLGLQSHRWGCGILPSKKESPQNHHPLASKFKIQIDVKIEYPENWMDSFTLQEKCQRFKIDIETYPELDAFMPVQGFLSHGGTTIQSSWMTIT